MEADGSEMDSVLPDEPVKKTRLRGVRKRLFPHLLKASDTAINGLFVSNPTAKRTQGGPSP